MRQVVGVACISVAWIAFITVLFVLPPNHLTGYIFGGTLVALLFFYLIAVRGKFRGPACDVWKSIGQTLPKDRSW